MKTFYINNARLGSVTFVPKKGETASYFLDGNWSVRRRFKSKDVLEVSFQLDVSDMIVIGGTTFGDRYILLSTGSSEPILLEFPRTFVEFEKQVGIELHRDAKVMDEETMNLIISMMPLDKGLRNSAPIYHWVSQWLRERHAILIRDMTIHFHDDVKFNELYQKLRKVNFGLYFLGDNTSEFKPYRF